jgi:gp16 family phage-associated protein
MTKSKSLKTPEQVWDELHRAGISLREWARTHNVSYPTAKAVLGGQVKASRGKAHVIALALGLKEGTVMSPKLFCPPTRRARPDLKLAKGPEA